MKQNREHTIVRYHQEAERPVSTYRTNNKSEMARLLDLMSFQQRHWRLIWKLVWWSYLYPLFMNIWKSRCFLWKDRYLIKIPKKGDLSSCSNYRMITFLSISSKVFNCVLLNRIKMLWTLCYDTRKLVFGPTDLFWPDCISTYYLRAVSGVELTSLCQRYWLRKKLR